jgi:hypothetical protein
MSRLTPITKKADPKSYFANPWLWVISVAVVAFAVYLGQQEGVAISFAFLSVVIATFFASRSFAVADRSLQLTRATSRPFLSVQLSLSKGLSPDRAILVPSIQNTGRLPADSVAVDCSWYIKKNDGVEPCSLRSEKPSPSIIFPADKAEPTYLVMGKELVDKLAHEGSNVKVTIHYQNKLTRQSHTIRRTFRITLTSASPSIDMAQAVAVPEEDYWD